MTPRWRWFPTFMKFMMSATLAAVTALFLFVVVDRSMMYLGVRDPLVERVEDFLEPLLCVAVAAVGVGCAAMEVLDQRARWRLANGCCVHCGYKLKGIREIAPNCPECGRPFKTIHRVP